MKIDMPRLIAVLLCLLMFLPLIVSCGGSDPDKGKQQTVTTAAAEEEAGEEKDTRFVGVNFDGKKFRIFSSSDKSDSTSANEMIAGSGEENGEVVNDAVYKRNLTVEEMLNIELAITEADYTYSNAQTNLRTLVMSGDDLYDCIINDVFALIPLQDENILWNIANAPNFDFSKSYWYSSTLDDLSIIDGHTYVMAGDFFMDCLMASHTMFYNKNMCESYFKDGNYINNLVLDGEWNYDNAGKVTTACYADLDGNGQSNEGDQFGFMAHGTWGSIMPFIVASGIDYIDKTQDPPVLDFGSETSVKLVESINKFYHNEAVLTAVTNNSDPSTGLRMHFGAGLALIVGYNRLDDLSRMRDFEFDVAIIPYPKLLDSNPYYTSIHDTTEMGAIPITCPDLDFATTCIEVLNRETSTILMPQYYEVALKIKYTHDEVAAQMIDLVHDSIGSCFPVAYNSSIGSLLNCFTDCVGAKSNDFMSKYNSNIAASQAKLEEMIEGILANSVPVF